MINKILILMVLLITISGCTNKSYYKSFQTNKSDCSKLAVQHRSDCLKQVDESISYEEYEKEREKL